MSFQARSIFEAVRPSRQRQWASEMGWTAAQCIVMKNLATLTATVGVALLLTGSLNGGAAKADHRPCHNSKAMVDLSQPEDWETACAGAIDAISFLEANGFRLAGPIHIHPMGEITEGVLADAFGYFDSRTAQVHVQSFSASQRAVQGVGIFGLPMDRDLYRSIVIHEVAHAIASHNFTMERPPGMAQEYIAYATQLATMPPSLRDRILANFPGEGFRTSMEISPAIHMLSPENFAVRVYRHFVRAENGAAFFRRLFTGEIQLDLGLMQ